MYKTTSGSFSEGVLSILLERQFHSPLVSVYWCISIAVFFFLFLSFFKKYKENSTHYCEQGSRSKDVIKSQW